METPAEPRQPRWRVRLAVGRRKAKKFKDRLREGYPATHAHGSVLIATETDTEAMRIAEEVRVYAPPGSDAVVERETIPRYPKWQVRVVVERRDQLKETAARLAGAGFRTTRRWRSLLLGASTMEEANELAHRIEALALKVQAVRVERASRLWLIIAGGGEPGPAWNRDDRISL